MNRLVLTTVFIFLLALGTQARDWGFSKDTVYAWKLGGDNVLLRNQGMDTLRADTIISMLIWPMNVQRGLMAEYNFTALTPTYSQHIGVEIPFSSGDSGFKYLRLMSIPQNNSDSLFGFSLDYPPIAGSAGSLTRLTVISAIGDTLMARLIFAAKSNRGRDTLILIGIQQQNSGIFHWDNLKRFHTDSRVFDPAGKVYSFPNRSFYGVPLLRPTQ